MIVCFSKNGVAKERFSLLIEVLKNVFFKKISSVRD
tara:strand:- start:1767 stop:1874 length:108 start_codon:yes stop_codon:yes gene_type:complete